MSFAACSGIGLSGAQRHGGAPAAAGIAYRRLAGSSGKSSAVPKIIGAKAHSARLKRIRGHEMVRQVGAALFAGGQIIEAEWAGLITAGAVSGAGHVASSPGEPPNADTHFLDRSIQTVQVAPLKVHTFNDAPYAVDLETGNSRMEARPSAGPATARKRKEVTQLVRKAVDKVVRGGSVIP